MYKAGFTPREHKEQERKRIVREVEEAERRARYASRKFEAALRKLEASPHHHKNDPFGKRR